MTKEEAEQLLGKLFGEMYDEIFQFALTYLRNKQLAEEAVQEVFYQAWCHADTLAEHENKRGWIYNAAKNEIMKIRSKEARVLKYETLTGEFLQKPGSEDAYDFLVLDEFSHMVNAEQMELLKSRYQDRNTYAEMAEDFGKSEGACKMALSRIRRRIRDLMDRAGKREREQGNDREEK